ncbi:MAG TPA: hypothetical protein VFM30_04865 [Steroidobacteraceae bacterium]|jgi:hypothetical protein|nr:hypothetical protein [Steroidobacteraceae bacterium]
MSENPRNPNPGMPDDDSNEGGRRQARPEENDERNRKGQPGEGTTPGQNPSKQRED